MKPYLYLVREAAFRNAIAQIWMSLHTSAFEHGCYTRPKTPSRKTLHLVQSYWRRGTLYIVLSVKPKPYDWSF